MAKNYTFAEAVEIINKGTDMESITDIGRRYPILLHKVTKVAALAGEDFVELMSYLPDHLTANKVNTSMKNVLSSEIEDEDETETDDENKNAKEKAKTGKPAETESTGSDYESMSGKELWDILGKAGKRKDCKEKMGGTKKENMIAYINKYGLGDTIEEEDEVEETEDVDSGNPYEGISAPELFKECKKRGLKAAPKKPAKYYVDLLMKADEEVAKKSETDEDDDWEDEVEEPKAEKEKKTAKTTKKAAPAKEETTDEDDDWDI